MVPVDNPVDNKTVDQYVTKQSFRSGGYMGVQMGPQILIKLPKDQKKIMPADDLGVQFVIPKDPQVEKQSGRVVGWSGLHGVVEMADRAMTNNPHMTTSPAFASQYVAIPYAAFAKKHLDKGYDFVINEVQNRPEFQKIKIWMVDISNIESYDARAMMCGSAYQIVLNMEGELSAVNELCKHAVYMYMCGLAQSLMEARASYAVDIVYDKSVLVYDASTMWNIGLTPDESGSCYILRDGMASHQVQAQQDLPQAPAQELLFTQQDQDEPPAHEVQAQQDLPQAPAQELLFTQQDRDEPPVKEAQQDRDEPPAQEAQQDRDEPPAQEAQAEHDQDDSSATHPPENMNFMSLLSPAVRAQLEEVEKKKMQIQKDRDNAPTTSSPSSSSPSTVPTPDLRKPSGAPAASSSPNSGSSFGDTHDAHSKSYATAVTNCDNFAAVTRTDTAKTRGFKGGVTFALKSLPSVPAGRKNR